MAEPQGLTIIPGRARTGDEPADRVELPTPPAPTGPPAERTTSWPARAEAAPPADDTGGFTPRQAIAPRTGRALDLRAPGRRAGAAARAADDLHPDPGGRDLLGDAPSSAWGTRRLYRAIATVILALVGLIALLWSRWPIPLAGLKALELGMVGLLAGRFAFVAVPADARVLARAAT